MKESIIKGTYSICPVCYEEILASIFVENNSVYMKKTCVRHGEFKALVEPDALFYRLNKTPGKGPYDDVVFLDVTGRCNTKCSYCYYPLNNIQDPTIPELIQAWASFPSKEVVITGGEPTMREDLPELIKRFTEIGVRPILLTNGICLADGSYLRELLKAGLSGVFVSLHHEGDNPASVWKSKLKALEEIGKARNGLSLFCLMSTVDTLCKIEGLLEVVKKYRNIVSQVRIRSAVANWAETKTLRKIFVSDLFKCISDLADKAKAPLFINENGDNNLYHLNCMYDGIPLRLICWPDKYNVDLLELQCGPYQRAHNGQIVNFVRYCLINEGMRKGYLFGRRFVVASPKRRNEKALMWQGRGQSENA